jgi:hypothetical protein
MSGGLCRGLVVFTDAVRATTKPTDEKETFGFLGRTHKTLAAAARPAAVTEDWPLENTFAIFPAAVTLESAPRRGNTFTHLLALPRAELDQIDD